MTPSMQEVVLRDGRASLGNPMRGLPRLSGIRVPRATMSCRRALTNAREPFGNKSLHEVGLLV